MDSVPAAERVVILAQGLLMYLPPEKVRALIAACARRFRRGVLVFDTIPPWVGALTRRGITVRGYTPPPMPWTIPAGSHATLAGLDPAISAANVVAPQRSGGLLYSGVLPLAERVPGLRYALPCVIRLDFE